MCSTYEYSIYKLLSLARKFISAISNSKMLLARNQTLISLASEGGTHRWNGSNAHYIAELYCGGGVWRRMWLCVYVWNVVNHSQQTSTTYRQKQQWCVILGWLCMILSLRTDVLACAYMCIHYKNHKTKTTKPTHSTHTHTHTTRIVLWVPRDRYICKRKQFNSNVINKRKNPYFYTYVVIDLQKW